ncbi:MAG: flavin-dependent monooxygenase, partial [Rhodobacteraceae bacterium]|nr:flavin-dependent monooxygenase [Paracoccaceae bacterium]
CFQHAADLLRAAGASALYRGSPLLRFFNDMLAARQHAANQYELHARNDGAALFGQGQEDMLL